MDHDLTTLGLTVDEARIYAVLVDNPPLTRGEVADLWNRGGRQDSEALLAQLEAYGLVTSVTSDASRLAATSPEIGLAGLADRKLADLAQAKARVTQEYARRWVQGGHAVDPRDLVEIVVGRAAIHQRVMAMQRTASEVCGFDKPPYASPTNTNDIEMSNLGEGVAYRCIYESSALEMPGKLALIESAQRSGEQSRISSGLPMKMIMADRTMAIVPLESAPDSIEVAAVVHASALLDSLYLLFELVWASATPLGDLGSPSDRPGGVESQNRPVSGGHDDLPRKALTMLAAGFPDKAIARSLGVTERTVQRWVKQMMADHGAQTRLQLGIKLGRTGVSPSSRPG